MACFVPFNGRDLDISLFIFRPTVVLVDEFVDDLKQFSLCTESLGCVQNSIFKSIHGNMIIWYGAWLKRSCENKEALSTSLVSMLTNISSKGILIEHSFFDAYDGGSKDGFSGARFSTGDTISMNAAISSDEHDLNHLSYACLALFKSCFLKMEGVAAGVCLRCQSKPRVACLYVWKSIQFCYSWILNSDHRSSILPYLDNLSLDFKYDIFRVVYVSGDNVQKFQFSSPTEMLENGGGSNEAEIMQD
jgi:hypothetical protein